MNVIFVTEVGEFVSVVGFDETILEMKQQIEQHLGVQVADQILTVYGIELIDGLDMGDYPMISEGTRIELTLRPPTPLPELDEKFVLTMKLSTRWVDIEVDRTETVRNLKEKIHIIAGTPIKRITLVFSGIEMKEDHRYLCEYGICSHSEITVIHKSGNGLRAEPTARTVSFNVQTASCLMNSAIIPVEIKDATTVSELRKMLLDEKILPRDDYFFIHKQRIMQDNCSLRWHGVENRDFLYVFKGTVSREI